MNCAHHNCTCMVIDGDEFCSPACRTGIQEAGKCFCGHKECAAS